MVVNAMYIKKTYSFSEENIEQLEQLVPKSKRSRFLDSALARAIEEETKANALKALEAFKRIKTNGDSVTETLRQIRQNESSRLSQ